MKAANVLVLAPCLVAGQHGVSPPRWGQPFHSDRCRPEVWRHSNLWRVPKCHQASQALLNLYLHCNVVSQASGELKKCGFPFAKFAKGPELLRRSTSWAWDGIAWPIRYVLLKVPDTKCQQETSMKRTARNCRGRKPQIDCRHLTVLTSARSKTAVKTICQLVL